MMKEMPYYPKVSIIIPTYNRKHLIQPAIDCVLEQSFKDYELIIVDDASTDGTPEFILQTYGNVNNLRAIRLKQNKGGGGARNEGILLAHGEYVAFLDDDDRWYPTFLEKLVSALDENQDSVLAFCNVSETDEKYSAFLEKFVPWPGYPVIDHRVLLTNDIIAAPSAMMIRHTSLKEVGLFNNKLRWCEDKDLYLRLLCLAKFTHVPETLAIKISHSGNLVNGQEKLISADKQVIDSFFANSKNQAYKEFEADAKSYILLRQAQLAKWYHRNYFLMGWLILQALIKSPSYVLQRFQEKLGRGLPVFQRS